jgi:hypothetical protein
VGVDAGGHAVMVLDTGAVVKYSASGERLWTRPAGNKTRGADVVVDEAGASFVLRNAETVSFLTKLSADGDVVWERNLGERWVFDVALDPSGGLWSLAKGVAPSSPHMSRYSAEGELLWSRDVVSEQSEVTRLEVDSSGNAFIVGKEGDVRLSKRYGTYLAEYDAEGNPLWGEALGLEGGAGARDLAVAPDGAVFVTGDYPDAPTGAFIIRMSPHE